MAENINDKYHFVSLWEYKEELIMEVGKQIAEEMLGDTFDSKKRKRQHERSRR